MSDAIARLIVEIGAMTLTEQFLLAIVSVLGILVLYEAGGALFRRLWRST